AAAAVVVELEALDSVHAVGGEGATRARFVQIAVGADGLALRIEELRARVKRTAARREEADRDGHCLSVRAVEAERVGLARIVDHAPDRRIQVDHLRAVRLTGRTEAPAEGRVGIARGRGAVRPALRGR